MQPSPWPKLWNHKYALCPLLPQSSKMKKSLTSFPKIHNTPLIFHSYAFLMEVGIGGTTARVQPCWYCGPLPHAIECVKMCLEGLGGAVTHSFPFSFPFFFFLPLAFFSFFSFFLHFCRPLERRANASPLLPSSQPQFVLHTPHSPHSKAI